MLVDGIPDRYRLSPFATRTAPAAAAPSGSPSAPARATSSTRSSPSSARSRRPSPTSSSGSATTSTPTPPRSGCSPRTTAASARSPRRCRSCAASRSSRSGTTTISGSTTPTAPARSAKHRSPRSGNTGRIRRYGLPDGPGIYLPVRLWRRRLLHAGRPLLPRAQPGSGRAGEVHARQAPGRMAARGPAREPRAVQGARLRQRLVVRGRADGRHLGRVPHRAQRAVRLHPRQPHRRRVPDLGRHALRRSELRFPGPSAAATTSTTS